MDQQEIYEGNEKTRVNGEESSEVSEIPIQTTGNSSSQLENLINMIGTPPRALSSLTFELENEKKREEDRLELVLKGQKEVRDSVNQLESRISALELNVHGISNNLANFNNTVTELVASNDHLRAATDQILRFLTQRKSE